MSGFSTVLAKECVDNFRDRRTILSSLGVAFFGPLLFVALMAFVLDTAIGESSESVDLAVVGADNAPLLMAFLSRQNLNLARIDADLPREEVVAGRHRLILVIESNYAERYNRGAPNGVTLIFDSSEFGKAQRSMRVVRQLISAYGGQIGLLRLHMRGIDPSITTPVVVQEVDVASPAARALTILATLPYLLVLVIFMGGFYLAIDATAGEREHGSLEPLLCQPVSRAQLVLGKLAAASVFSTLSLLLFLVSLALSLPFVPLHRVGMSLNLDFVTGIMIVLIALPLIVFGAALLTVVASFARSYKEAQTYLTIVILIPTLPLIVTRMLNVEASTALMAVPSLSQATLIGDLIAGTDIQWLHVAIAYVATGAVAGLLAWLAIYLYRRERILI